MGEEEERIKECCERKKNKKKKKKGIFSLFIFFILFAFQPTKRFVALLKKEREGERGREMKREKL